MPRLTNRDYQKRHELLRCLWLEHKGMYGRLSTREQWDLHAYYQPSKDLSTEELLQHRCAISEERSSLPARAGKAYRALRTNHPHANATKHHYVVGGREREMTLTAIVNPEIDIPRLARALWDIAGQIAQEDAIKGATDREDDARIG